MAEWEGGGAPSYNERMYRGMRDAPNIPIYESHREPIPENRFHPEPKPHKLPSGRTVLIYPMREGETFRKITYMTSIDGSHLSIKSQKDIDDLKTLLCEIEEITNPPKKQSGNQNRFANIDLVD